MANTELANLSQRIVEQCEETTATKNQLEAERSVIEQIKTLETEMLYQQQREQEVLRRDR